MPAAEKEGTAQNDQTAGTATVTGIAGAGEKTPAENAESKDSLSQPARKTDENSAPPIAPQSLQERYIL